MRGLVLLTHWMLEFMKHVLPRLLRPVAPFSVGTMGRGGGMGRKMRRRRRREEGVAPYDCHPSSEQ